MAAVLGSISQNRITSTVMAIMVALELPLLESRSMVPRDDAVRAVSLPEKKNAMNRKNRTARTMSQSESVIVRQASRQGRRAAAPDRHQAQYRQPQCRAEG